MGGDGIQDMDGLSEATEWYVREAHIDIKIKAS
jgi:hypothetical protein